MVVKGLRGRCAGGETAGRDTNMTRPLQRRDPSTVSTTPNAWCTSSRGCLGPFYLAAELNLQPPACTLRAFVPALERQGPCAGLGSSHPW